MIVQGLTERILMREATCERVLLSVDERTLRVSGWSPADTSWAKVGDVKISLNAWNYIQYVSPLIQRRVITFSSNIDLNRPFSILLGSYWYPVSYKNLGQESSATRNSGWRLRTFFLTLTIVSGIVAWGVQPLTQRHSSYIQQDREDVL